MYPSVTYDGHVLVQKDDFFYGLLGALCADCPRMQRFVIRVEYGEPVQR
jgi:hypothetical protein